MGRKGGAEDEGRVPNVTIDAVSKDSLRQHPRYNALRERKAAVDDPGWARQDSPEWENHHVGRLTSRNIGALLGFYEPRGVKALGMPTSSADHGRAKDCQLELMRGREGNGANDCFWSEPVPNTPVSMCREAARSGKGAVQKAWGKAQEARAIMELLEVLPGVQVHEVGLLVCTEQRVREVIGEPPKGMPEMGSSPDGIVEHPSGEKEALEVKCATPFALAAGAKRYRLREAKPLESVPPWHVPQMQLHLLASGLERGVLVSWSPWRGLQGWRIRRDDEFLGMMVRAASAFYRSYVLNPVQIPSSFSLGETSRILLRSKGIAR